MEIGDGSFQMDPDNSIMEFVDNVEPLYSKKMALFEFWISAGDDLKESVIETMAFELGRDMAGKIRVMGLLPKKSAGFKKSEVDQFVEDLLQEFEEYREYKIKEVVERPREVEQKATTAEDAAWAQKCDDNAKRIGIERLQSLIPVPPEQIRRALEANDPYLNTISLRKWDAAANSISYPNLSLSEKVCALKHVAKWYYA